MKTFSLCLLFLLMACANSQSPTSNMIDADDGDSSGVGARSSTGGAGASADDASSLPRLPTTNHEIARHWVDLEEIASLKSVTSRDGIAYFAGVLKGARIDLAARSSMPLDPAPDASWSFEDVAAPPGTSVVVAVLLRGDIERLIRYSKDDGRSWQTATAPAPLSGTGGWSRVTWTLSSKGPARLFVLHGGPTLDMSEDNGATWQRVVASDAQWPAAGFSSDASGEILWAVSEGALDVVAAFWFDTSGSQLPTQWQQQIAYLDRYTYGKLACTIAPSLEAPKGASGSRSNNSVGFVTKTQYLRF